MSSKINHNKLMDYLYGEMEEQEKREFENLLEKNPDLKNEFENLRRTRQLLKNVSNQEVEQPLWLNVNQNPVTHTGFYKKTGMIAASIVIVLLVFNFSGFNASYQDGSLNIRFGKAPNVGNELEAPIEEQDFSMKAIEKILVQREDSIYNRISEMQKMLITEIEKSKQTKPVVSEAALKAFSEELARENYQRLADLIVQANQDQKIFSENLMLDFADYMEEQRLNDLQLIEYAINSLQQNTEVQQQETAILLTQLLSQMTQNEN